MITTDNLRKFRRFIVGRGINERETVVSVGTWTSSPNQVSVKVPGLQADDEIVVVQGGLANYTNYGDLDANIKRAVSAVTSIHGQQYEMRRPGVAGNKVKVTHRIDPTQAVSVTLSVGGTAAAPDIVVAVATSAVSADKAARFVETDPVVGQLLHVTRTAGHNVSTTVSATLSGGAADSQHGPVAAKTNLQDIVFTAAKAGSIAASAIEVHLVDVSTTISADQQPTVDLIRDSSGNYHLSIGITSANTTANAVVAAVEQALMSGAPRGGPKVADIIRAQLSAGATGTTALTSAASAFLTGGDDRGGFVLSAASGTVSVVYVGYLTRRP